MIPRLWMTWGGLLVGLLFVGVVAIGRHEGRDSEPTAPGTLASPTAAPARAMADRTPGDLTQEEAQRWIDFFDRTLGVMYPLWTKDGRTVEVQEKQAALAEFMSVDSDAMPPSVRYIYQLARLEWVRWERAPWDPRCDGYVLDLLATRQQLMRPRNGLQDHLSDANVLFRIASWLSSGIMIRPPCSVIEELKSQGLREADFSREHYADVDRAIETLEYVIAHFDPNYIATANALYWLASLRGGRNPREGIVALRHFMSLDLTGLYTIPEDDWTGTLVGQAVLKHCRNLSHRPIVPPDELRWFQKWAPLDLLHFAASIVPVEEALGELEALMGEFSPRFMEEPSCHYNVSYHLVRATIRKLLADEGIRSRQEAMLLEQERFALIVAVAVQSLERRYPWLKDALQRQLEDFTKAPPSKVLSAVYLGVR